MAVIPQVPSGLPAIRYSPEGLAMIVDVAGWPLADQPTAVAVALAESSGNPFNVNRASGAAGLFQILPSAHPDMIPNASDHGWMDPTQNARWALKIKQGSGWGAWQTHNTGAYLAFLGPAQLAVAAWHSAAAKAGQGTAAQKTLWASVLGTEGLALFEAGALSTGGLAPVAGAVASGASAGAQDISQFGNIAATTAETSVPGVAQAQGLLDLLVGAGKWITNPANISRVAQVLVGGALVIGALVVVVRPVASKLPVVPV